jgi:hypothetical protein
MVKLHFNYKDIFRAGRLGFSAKKIWTGFVGLLLGLLIYNLCAYVAFLITPEWNLKDIWQTFRLTPTPYFSDINLSVGGWIIFGAGEILSLFVLLLTVTAICKITIEQLRGDEFYESREAIKFTLQNWKGVLLSPITLLLFVVLLFIGGLLMGLIGRIPFAGPLFLGIFAIPFIGAGLFIAYLVIVFLVSFMIAPPVVATTKSDTFDTLFEVFSVVNDQPWRLVIWKMMLLSIAFVGVFILSFFVNLGLSITQWALSPFFLGFRGDLAHMWHNGLTFLPRIPPIPILESFGGLFAPSLLTLQPFHSVSWAGLIGSVLFGIAFYCITLFVFAYGLATLSAGDTLIYTILTKIKDDKNLLEVKEEEPIEEEVTPLKEEPEKEEEKKE